jgi:Cyclic nucleotide-binding domain
MKIEHSVTTVSWIPSEAVTGSVYKVPFSVGVSHYDAPPPDRLDDVEALVAADGCRFANRLQPWIEVEDGRVTGHGFGDSSGNLGSTTLRVGRQAVTFAAVSLPVLRETHRVGETGIRFVQTAGGRTGVPAPRRVNHPPYVQLVAPVAWTTLSVTLHADGRVEHALEGASPFPRHWVYDHGTLVRKSAVIDYRTWSLEAFGPHTPWGDHDSAALVREVETALERELSRRIMSAGARPEIRRLDRGALLTRQGHPGDDLFLLLDGVLEVEVDDRVVAEVAPGAVLGERALLEGGHRTSTLRAVTRCSVAVAPADLVDRHALVTLAEGHRREDP